MAAAKETDLARQTRIRYDSLLEQGEPANKQTMAKAAEMAASDIGRYPGEARIAAAAGERDAKFEARVDKALESNMPYLKSMALMWLLVKKSKHRFFFVKEYPAKNLHCGPSRYGGICNCARVTAKGIYQFGVSHPYGARLNQSERSSTIF
jgi:hypothetical protein